jgi:hypothetical protein
VPPFLCSIEMGYFHGVATIDFLRLTPEFARHNLQLVILNGQWFGSEFADWYYYYFTGAAEWRFRLA